MIVRIVKYGLDGLDRLDRPDEIRWVVTAVYLIGQFMFKNHNIPKL